MVKVVKADLEGLSEAALVVSKGGLIAYPTDTVYGLGCDPVNLLAVARVQSAKAGRTKPLPVLVEGQVVASKFAHFSTAAIKLAQKYWPGPLTIVLPAREGLPSDLAPKGTIGLRAPKHALCLRLLKLCSGALVGTSANLTGNLPATSAEEAVRELGERVDLILDGGTSPIGVASTVIELTGNRVKVLREGPISLQEIGRCLRAKSAR